MKNTFLGLGAKGWFFVCLFNALFGRILTEFFQGVIHGMIGDM